jgi:para-aminobenzoate synthetase component I
MRHMTAPLIKKLPYHPDSSQLFQKLKHLPWAAFLDSSFPESQQGRYDIITANPYQRLQTRGAITSITQGKKSYTTTANPFQLLKTGLTPSIPTLDNIPFPGGALGFFAYDLARQSEPLIPRQTERALPDMMIGIYDWAIIVDHHLQQTRLCCCPRHPNSIHDAHQLIQYLENAVPATTQPFQLLHNFSYQTPYAQYKKSFDQIKQYLHNGDCYQVNLTHRLTAPYQGSPWHAFQLLRKKNPMPFAAFLNFEDAPILSFSPERFIRVDQNIVTAIPIKGTCKRDPDPAIDQILAQQLQNCFKNRAENLMIVDLLRNDLNKICTVGSVHVPQLFQVDSYTGVHHLSSLIMGTLPDNKHSLDVLQTCFPGGSITGAPKIRAMQIIDEVEDYPRQVYCGSIGYIGFDGNLDSNIAIRTLTCKNNILHCHTGGAIVVDSILEDEYQESLDKIAVIRESLFHSSL